MAEIKMKETVLYTHSKIQSFKRNQAKTDGCK